MHKTAAGEKRKDLMSQSRELAGKAKALRKVAGITPTATEQAERFQAEAEEALAKAQALKPEARLEDLTIWEQRKVKQSKNGPKSYTYYMASWRDGKKVKNVYLGSSCKMSRDDAFVLARRLKMETLGLHLSI
jgi:hypothetical protein